MSEGKKICFVITPIGKEGSDIRRHIDGIIDLAIVPALQDKFNVEVAHRKYEIGSITNKVINSIYRADLVIANLTALNPNVMFELAIRYSFGKPAIVIAECGTELPFDINTENTIFYTNDPIGAAELKEIIQKFERDLDYKRGNYGPVYDALKEVSILESIESKEVGQNDELKYIVDRLDNIDKRLNKISTEDISFKYNNMEFKPVNLEGTTFSDVKKVFIEPVIKSF